MEKRQPEIFHFDASAYLLFEATGDSDCRTLEDEYSGAADDDAESSSYGPVVRRENHTVRFRKSDIMDVEDGEDDDEEEEEEGVVDQCRRGKKVAPPPAVMEESNSKMVVNKNDRERDRRFWEACLAS